MSGPGVCIRGSSRWRRRFKEQDGIALIWRLERSDRAAGNRFTGCGNARFRVEPFRFELIPRSGEIDREIPALRRIDEIVDSSVGKTVSGR